MKVSGTAPNYRGLYSCAANSTVVSMDLIDDVPADFPEVWKPSDFVGAMVEIDEVLETNAEDFVKSYVQKGGQ